MNSTAETTYASAFALAPMMLVILWLFCL